MVDFIISLKNGDKYHLKTDYKKITVNNKMAILFYVEQFSQVSRYDIKSDFDNVWLEKEGIKC